MTTITICTQKGGVAKTTTAEALILYLRKKGYKVLAIDLDLQGNLSNYFKFDPSEKKTVFDFIDGSNDPKSCIVNDMLAGGSRLRYLVSFFNDNQLNCLKKAIESNKLDYDVIVIDTPPAINRVVLSALVASDYVIVPTEPTIDSLLGIQETIKAVDAVKSMDNANLSILGTVLVKYKERYTLHRQFKEALEKMNIIPIFNSSIRESQAINTAKAKHNDFFMKEYAYAKGINDYADFAEEVIEKAGLKANKKVK